MTAYTIPAYSAAQNFPDSCPSHTPRHTTDTHTRAITSLSGPRVGPIHSLHRLHGHHLLLQTRIGPIRSLHRNLLNFPHFHPKPLPTPDQPRPKRPPKGPTFRPSDSHEARQRTESHNRKKRRPRRQPVPPEINDDQHPQTAGPTSVSAPPRYRPSKRPRPNKKEVPQQIPIARTVSSRYKAPKACKAKPHRKHIAAVFPPQTDSPRSQISYSPFHKGSLPAPPHPPIATTSAQTTPPGNGTTGPARPATHTRLPAATNACSSSPRTSKIRTSAADTASTAGRRSPP